MRFVDSVLEIAKQQSGQKEEPKGSNRGPMVTQYQNRTGYPGGGVPWCLCFCYWCIDQACRAASIPNALKKTGSCDVVMAWAKQQGVLHTDPKIGDIGLVLAARGSLDAVHAFFVTGVDEECVRTLEGNSNNDGSREGYEVVPRGRPRSAKIVYVRWADLAGFHGATVKTTPPASPASVEPPPPACEKAAVVIAGTKLGDFEVLDGLTMVPAREALNHLAPKDQAARVGAELAWDGESRTLHMGDHVLASQVLVRDGVSSAHVRKIVSFANEVFGTKWTLSSANSVITIA